MRKSAIAVLGITLITIAPAIVMANCYVIKNENKENIQLSFYYNGKGPVPNEGAVNATVFPHQQYPLKGEWCLNGTGGYSVAIMFTGAGHLRGPNRKIWKGPPVPIFGDGPNFAPSGTYTIGPP